jgi:hypothetical protein
MVTIPQTEYRSLIQIINSEYTDGVDRILSAQMDDSDRISCTAIDGSKRLGIKIDGDSISIRLITGSAQFSSPEPDDPIDPILTQLKPIGDATFAEWFTTLQSLMQESDNLTEFRDKLTDSYPDLDATEFKRAMLDASTIAGMKGYSSAKDGD